MTGPTVGKIETSSHSRHSERMPNEYGAVSPQAPSKNDTRAFPRVAPPRQRYPLTGPSAAAGKPSRTSFSSASVRKSLTVPT
jgi:hypothetical protein